MSKSTGIVHWWLQRVTALATLALLGALCWSARTWPWLDPRQMVELLSQSTVRFLVALTVGVVFWHSALGIQMVIEDYVSTLSTRRSLITLYFSVLILLYLGIIYLLWSLPDMPN